MEDAKARFWADDSIASRHRKIRTDSLIVKLDGIKKFTVIAIGVCWTLLHPVWSLLPLGLVASTPPLTAIACGRGLDRGVARRRRRLAAGCRLLTARGLQVSPSASIQPSHTIPGRIRERIRGKPTLGPRKALSRLFGEPVMMRVANSLAVLRSVAEPAGTQLPCLA